jgi:hypothetical protein
MKNSNIKTALENESGYLTGIHLTQFELLKIRSLITSSWLMNISKNTSPQITEQFEKAGINRYHELSHLLDHGSMWPKVNRILNPDAVAEIRSMSLIRKLEDEFGYFEISDEDNVGHEEIYWRLVRPNSPTDVGPLHADAWFWDLGHGVTPPGCKRVKVWIAIYCTPGKDGFKFVPGSHKHEWSYRGELKDGITKPKIDISEDQVDVIIFNSQPGESIIFNDKLLHGGAVGQNETRVSLEFTMFVKNENYYI